MKVLTIVNNKGGVGKTTTAQNIAAGLARFGNNSVLMIDLDSQASLTRSCGFKADAVKNNSGSFIANEALFSDTVLKITETLHLLPSSSNLAIKEDNIKSSATFPFNLKIALGKIQDQYDFVIVDCPPALSGLTRIAIVACNSYFVPLQAEFLSYEGLRNLLDFAAEIKQISPDINLGGVFATRYNPNVKKKISNELIESARSQLGEIFMNTYIRDNVSLSEAQATGTDIFSYNQDSNGAQDYYSLTKEIISKFQ